MYFIVLSVVFLVIDPTFAQEEKKLCRYRDVQALYPPEAFLYLSGGECYVYTNKLWLINNTLLQVVKYPIEVDGTNYSIPVANYFGTPLYFDHRNESYVQKIKSLFKETSYFNKWKMCAEEAMDCCLNKLDNENIYPDEEYPCPALWDGFSCFLRAKAYTTSYNLCPLYTTSGDGFICNLQSEKYCLSDDWNHVTNYLVCSSSFTYRKRHNFHLIVLYIATTLIFPSIIIYFSFEKLKILRTILHRNLIISIFVKNVLVIISKNLVILDAINARGTTVMDNDGTWCRILAFFENLSKSVIFTFMTADAFYLHKLIVRPFGSEPNPLHIYIISAVTSTLPTVIWAILLGVNDTGKCWMALEKESWIQWITDGYKYAMLGLNLILLLDIIRVLFMKLGKNTNRNQTKSALRATLILLPLFGVPLLISSQRSIVNMDDCLAGDIYYYVTYSIEALQGILLATYFCYLNAEVHKELSNAYRKLDMRIRDMFGLPEKQRDTVGPRTTRTTTVQRHL